MFGLGHLLYSVFEGILFLVAIDRDQKKYQNKRDWNGKLK